MLEQLATIVAGLGMFFAGCWLLTANLKEQAGTRLHSVVKNAIRRPFRGLFCGIIIGGLTQTTTVAVFILVSLIAAGVTTIKATLPVLLGVNIGTSVLIFLASLDIESVVLLVTGVAGMLLTSNKSVVLRASMRALFGLGLLFIGIDMLQQGAASLSQHTWVEPYLAANSDAYVTGFTAGVALRVLTQSGAAVTLMAASLYSADVIGIEQTIIIIYGANFGAAVSTWLFSWGAKGPPREIIRYQVLFDVLGTAIFLPLFYLEVQHEIPLVEFLVVSLTDNVEQQMAFVYLFHNVFSAVALAGVIACKAYFSERSQALTVKQVTSTSVTFPASLKAMLRVHADNTMNTGNNNQDRIHPRKGSTWLSLSIFMLTAAIATASVLAHNKRSVLQSTIEYRSSATAPEIARPITEGAPVLNDVDVTLTDYQVAPIGDIEQLTNQNQKILQPGSAQTVGRIAMQQLLSYHVNLAGNAIANDDHEVAEFHARIARLILFGQDESE